MDIRTKGLNHLCFPTYYRGPFVASNIANMYCTECIIGIIQNPVSPLGMDSGQGLWPISKCRKGSRPVNSHHGYTDKGIEPPVLSYILHRPIRSVQYCEYVLHRMLSYRTQELPLGSASPVLGVMREGLNHLCFPTYYRGPFVASNIANMYCTQESVFLFTKPSGNSAYFLCPAAQR